jgi:hypothetical protein
MTDLSRIARYNAYCAECHKQGETPESFVMWGFINLTDADLRPAMLQTKARNSQFIESQYGSVLTPNGRAKMNSEYVDRAVRLRAFQKAQREADPEWMAHDQLTHAYATYDTTEIGKVIPQGDKGLSINERYDLSDEDLLRREMGIYPEAKSQSFLDKISLHVKSFRKRRRDKKDIDNYHKAEPKFNKDEK